MIIHKANYLSYLYSYVWNKNLNIFIIFAAISNAFAILTDPEKRMEYDLNGSDEGNLHHEYNYTRGFEGNYYIKLTINFWHCYFQYHVVSIDL